jgi:hypothetical protein
MTTQNTPQTPPTATPKFAPTPPELELPAGRAFRGASLNQSDSKTMRYFVLAVVILVAGVLAMYFLSAAKNASAPKPVKVEMTTNEKITAEPVAQAPMPVQAASSDSSSIPVSESLITANAVPAGKGVSMTVAPAATQAPAVVPAPVVKLPDPVTLADAKDQISKLRADLATAASAAAAEKVKADEADRQARELELKVADLVQKLDANEKQKNKMARAAAAASKAQSTPKDDMLALNVLSIGSQGVVVSDASSREFKVSPGGRLPGGATFIGFDASRRLMLTDRGDFQIP